MITEEQIREIVREEISKWIGIHVHVSLTRARTPEEMEDEMRKKRERKEEAKREVREEKKRKIERVAQMAEEGMELREWHERIMDAFKVGRSAAYAWMEEARRKNLVRVDGRRVLLP